MRWSACQSFSTPVRANSRPARTPLFRWHLGDGQLAEGPRIEHVYKSPGFYRVGLTVTSGPLSDLAWRDLYVIEPVDEIGTEGAETAAQWSFIDPQSRVTFQSDADVKIVGNSSLRALVNPYGGERVSLRFPAAADLQIPLKGKSKLVFWIKSINENVPAWQNANPVVTLYESPTKFVRLEPRQDLLSNPPYNEARDGWTYITVPLQGDELWKREGDEHRHGQFLDDRLRLVGGTAASDLAGRSGDRVKPLRARRAAGSHRNSRAGARRHDVRPPGSPRRRSRGRRPEEYRRPCNQGTRGNRPGSVRRLRRSWSSSPRSPSARAWQSGARAPLGRAGGC